MLFRIEGKFRDATPSSAVYWGDFAPPEDKTPFPPILTNVGFEIKTFPVAYRILTINSLELLIDNLRREFSS